MLEEMDLGDMGPSPAPTPQPSTVWSRGAHPHGHAHAHDADHDANDSAVDEGTPPPPPPLSTICASGLNLTHQDLVGLTILLLPYFKNSYCPLLCSLINVPKCAEWGYAQYGSVYSDDALCVLQTWMTPCWGSTQQTSGSTSVSATL